MPETAKQVLKARTESHSDVAHSDPAKAYQARQTEREFCGQLIRLLRENKGDVRLRNLTEEWITTEDGLVHELSAECMAGES